MWRAAGGIRSVTSLWVEWMWVVLASLVTSWRPPLGTYLLGTYLLGTYLVLGTFQVKDATENVH